MAAVGALYGTVKKLTTAKAVKCRMSVVRCPISFSTKDLVVWSVGHLVR